MSPDFEQTFQSRLHWSAASSPGESLGRQGMSSAELRQPFQRRLVRQGMDERFELVLGLGLAALLMLAIAAVLPEYTHSVDAGGFTIRTGVLLVDSGSGIVLFLLTLAVLTFCGVALFALQRPLWQVSVLLAAGWGIISFIWLLDLAFNQPGNALDAEGIRYRTGAGIYVGLSAAAGVAVTFSLLAYRLLRRRFA
ncbi:MAG TPA: hypothetical protein VG013_18490 [Gemmataceae bacterium]|nr:hypothetical protein [Gemmataceae bacterium]